MVVGQEGRCRLVVWRQEAREVVGEVVAAQRLPLRLIRDEKEPSRELLGLAGINQHQSSLPRVGSSQDPVLLQPCASKACAELCSELRNRHAEFAIAAWKAPIRPKGFDPVSLVVREALVPMEIGQRLRDVATAYENCDG